MPLYWLLNCVRPLLLFLIGIVADEADQTVAFHTATSYGHVAMTSSISSLAENGGIAADPFDFSVYMDQVCRYSNIYPCYWVYSRWAHGTSFKAPLTVYSNSPLELVQQFFTKLGARYVVVTDMEGYCACGPIGLSERP